MRKALAAILFLFSSHCWSDDLTGAKTRERVQPHALSAEVSYLLRTRIGVTEKGFGVYYHHRCHLQSRSVECKGEHLPWPRVCSRRASNSTISQPKPQAQVPIHESKWQQPGRNTLLALIPVAVASFPTVQVVLLAAVLLAGRQLLFFSPLFFPTRPCEKCQSPALDVQLRRPKVPGEQLPHTPCLAHVFHEISRRHAGADPHMAVEDASGQRIGPR